MLQIHTKAAWECWGTPPYYFTLEILPYLIYCQARVQVISRWTLKVSNLKVYFKSLRDLDLEFEAIIAISPPPTHHHFSEWNKIENSSHINSLVIKVKISESHIQTSRAEGPSSLCICLLFFRYQIWTCYSRKSVAFLPRGTIPPLYWNNRNHWYQHFIQTGTNQMKHYSSWSSSTWFFPVCISLNLKAQLFFL